MKALNLPDLNPNSARQYEFLMIPTVLFTDPAFAGLDVTAVTIYAKMLNRAALSAEHPKHFTDETGRSFIIYTVEQVMEDFHLAKATAVKALKQLEEIGLIEKRRRGQGKPSLIYVKDFTAVQFAPSPEDPDPELIGGENPDGFGGTAEKAHKPAETSRSSKIELQEVHTLLPDSQKFKKQTSRSSEIELLEVQNLNPRYIEKRLSKEKEDLPSLLTSPPTEGWTEGSSVEELKEQIQYDTLVAEHGQGEVDEVVCLIQEVMDAQGGTVTLNGTILPITVVQERFAALEYQHVDDTLRRLAHLADARNPHAYLRAMLFNSTSCTQLRDQGFIQRDFPS